MSMIGSLIDELNKSADEWNESNMFELARMCRNAAYTILETRNDAELLRRMWKQARLEAQGLKSENAKLRESVKRLMTQRDERLARAESDNAKLRELVRDMFGAYKGTVEMLPSSYSKNVAEMAVMDISDRMRGLGVDE